MEGEYPRFKSSYLLEELVEGFQLGPEEFAFVASHRGDANRHGIAILLKSLLLLGYFPDGFQEVPESVRTFVAKQLGLLWDHADGYRWSGGTRDYHLAQIRTFTGWRFATTADKQELEERLRRDDAVIAVTSEKLLDAACRRFREQRIELPAEPELLRIVNASLNGYFQDLYEGVTSQIPVEVRARMDELLSVPTAESLSTFELLKADAANAGIENMSGEIVKLRLLRSVGVPASPFTALPIKVLKLLKRRASNEKAGEMREHPDPIRYALIGCFLHVRTMEVLDDMVRMAIDIIHRVDVRSDNQLTRELIENLKHVDGKLQILSRIAEAVVIKPDGIIREVLFPAVKEETFHDLVAEFRHSGPQYRLIKQTLMHNKYVRHYRRMLPMLLENVIFRSENRFQPVIEALDVIRRNVNKKGRRHRYFEENVPLDGVVSPSWSSKVLEEVQGETKVNRHYYELCVLQKLHRALKCKEVWVEGSHAFRNPNEDLPRDWNDEARRVAYYTRLGQPLDSTAFIESLKSRMRAALTDFDQRIPVLPHVRIYRPNNKSERGLFGVTKLEPQLEPHSLGLIKDRIGDEYGMLDLLDIFVEADRMIDFTRFFTHSGTKEVRSREQLRPLLLLDLFAEGTNVGIRRISKANRQYSYQELLYVRKTYFSAEALRNANGAVVGKLLAIRNPRLWGGGHACASDGKRFGSWSQNLMTEWRSRYRGDGVLVYWHVETNAVCIYAQARSFSHSEVAAMIEGLIRHDTEMRVEKNFVDSHGQSEVAFAFCHLLGLVKLMPRLKRIKYERLYLPDKEMSGQFPNLTGVLTRPIRWDVVEQQYDEMVKSAVGLKDGTATADAILKRFNSYNVTHPTYKALVEVGKAEKTIFLCDYLASRETQYEVNDGLQVVENWNATSDVICYGRRGELATNSREQQEITLLSLQLLQNCLMLINTILVERTLDRHGLWERLSREDLRALTPLFHTHINPYGVFEIHLESPSFLNAA